ncbi:hypothetical protein [Micromonospora chersina]|uniref:hypothetical protein n=1 Tax=Micromonospora chersina TaxID=47854 RepID=UPI003719DC66
MADKPRYSLRRKSVALTRAQWMAVCVAFAVAVVVGPIVALTVGLSAGSLVIGSAALTMAMVIAFGRMPVIR